MVRRPGTMTSGSCPRAGTVAVLAALALAAPAAAPAAAATAARAPAFALSSDGAAGPLRLHGTAGHVLRGAVRLRNLSRRPITVRLQPADIRTAANGNADYLTTRLSGAGRWLRLAATTVPLAPRETRRIAFTVRVPAGAHGASHYAGVVAVDTAELASAGARTATKAKSFSFQRINRQAVPLTVRLPGPLTRSLTLRSLRIAVAPAGAGLVLGLLPGGSRLIDDARVQLRVLRGSRTVFAHASTLGQLFPGSGLDFRIPWPGRPTQGSYRVVGVIRPTGAAAVQIDQTVDFSPATATRLDRETTPAAPPLPGMPVWVWVAFAAAGIVLVALSSLVWRLRR
jgi:hypothetical protein